MLLNINNETGHPFRHRALLNEVLAATLTAENIAPDIVVSLSIVTPAAMSALRATYLAKEGPTDVLAFPGSWSAPRAPGEALDLGDVVVCGPIVNAQAKQYGHSVTREWGYLFAHALYHLLGYDHATKTTEKQMHTKVEAIMRKINLTR